MRRLLVPIAMLAWLVGCLPAGAQSPLRPGLAPDPIDYSRALSTRPVPTVPAPEPPAERLVPERRVRVPETGKEVVVPAHQERRISDQQSLVPPLAGFGARGGSITHVPGGERPPAEVRQGP